MTHPARASGRSSLVNAVFLNTQAYIEDGLFL
ncbi:hypothetical protein VIAG107301_21010 [Vibrio agarivorans]